MSQHFNDKYSASGVELGHGMFGTVFECEDKTSKRKAAAKVIHKTLTNAEAINNEVNIMRMMSHPQIIHLYDSFDDGDHYTIVMEACSPQDLYDRVVAMKHYSEKDAKDVMNVLLHAVQHVHSKGVVHRDIKPDNVLLTSPDEDADIRLTDFGLSRVATGDTITGQAGSPLYLAPELLREKPYGKSVDVWALGVTLFILLSGTFPFMETSTDQKVLFRKICKGNFEFDAHWNEVSMEARDLVRKMMQVDVKKRYSIEEVLADPWMHEPAATLSSRSLAGSQERIREFNSKRKFKAAVHVVEGCHHMCKLARIDFHYDSDDDDDA